MSPAKVDKDGVINVKIGFNEPRRKLLKHLIKVYNDEYKKKVLEKPDIWIWLKKHTEELKNQKLEDSF